MFKQTILALMMGACITACVESTIPDTAPVSASLADFSILLGEIWEGELTYLNYNSPDRSTIPVKLKVFALADQTMSYGIQYPGEEQHNANESLTISADGTLINGIPVIRRETTPDGTLIITTQNRGEDENRSADIQLIFHVKDDEFQIRKNVRFEPDAAFFNRSQYVFRRGL